jgi:hypothetical protein
MRSVIDAIELGQLAAVDRAIAACARTARTTDLPHHLWPVASFRAMRATMNGRLEDAERFLNEARRISEHAQDPNADRTLLIQRYGLLRAREDNDGLLQLLPVLERAFDGMPNSSLYIAATIATILAREEHADQPWPAVDDSMLDEAIRLFDPTIVCHLGEMAAAREDVEMMARIATTLTSKQEHFAHWGLLAMTWEGPVSRYLALLADGMGKTQEADRLFGRAHDQCRALGTSPMAARTAYEHARSLADRGYGENRDRVISLLDAAERMATSLNLTGLLGKISSLRRTFERPPVSSTDRPGVTTGVPAVGFLSLTQDGEAWTCVCEGDTFRLKDTKGVRMLATLLAEPGREFHVLDLTDTRRSGESMDSGDAGEMLDATARAQYQRRVEELRGELEEAEAWNDPSRAERAREELDRIATELSRAFGLGGRERRSGSAAERARVNVQRRLRDAVKRIEQHSPAAAKHLSWALKTGTYCIYDPN